MLHCLLDLHGTFVNENNSLLMVQVNILDGSVIINMMQPGPAKTFQNLAIDVFVPCIASQLQHVSRLEIIWNVYVPKSLKADTHQKVR